MTFIVLIIVSIYQEITCIDARLALQVRLLCFINISDCRGHMYGGFLTNNMLILKILPIVPIESLGQPFHCQMVSLMFAKEAIVCGFFLIIKHRLRFLVKI